MDCNEQASTTGSKSPVHVASRISGKAAQDVTNKNSYTSSNKTQIRALVDFMSKNKDFATGKLTASKRDEQWIHLKKILKNYGKDRRIEQWKLTWRDLKGNAKLDIATSVKAASTMGNTGVPNVSEITRKIADIMGYEYTEKHLSRNRNRETRKDLDKRVGKKVTSNKQAVSSAGNSTNKKNYVRSRKAQIEALVDYMSKNRYFATGKYCYINRIGSEKQWFQLKKLLNKWGAERTIEQWKTTWRDLNVKARQEIVASSKIADATGNTETPYVSIMTRKIADIMGYAYKEKLLVQNNNGQDMTNEEDSPEHQVKIEEQDSDTESNLQENQELSANSPESNDKNNSTSEKPADISSRSTYLNNKQYTYEYFFQGNICRLCWSSTINNKCLKNDTETAQNILQYVGVDVATGTIKTVCNSCLDKIDSFIEFKNMCLEADRKLNDLMSTTDVSIYQCEIRLEDGNIKYQKENYIDDSNEDEIMKDSCDDSNENGIVEELCDDDKNDFVEDPYFDGNENDLVEDAVKKTDHKCSICAKELESYIEWRKHMALHKKDKKFICEICGVALKRDITLENHLRIHAGAKVFKCQKCNFCTAHTSSLRTHVKRMHSSERQFKCDRCNYSSVNMAYVRRHIKTTHSVDRPHKCQLCNKCFKYKMSLKNHINTYHQGRMDNSCKWCEAKYFWFTALRAHVLAKHKKVIRQVKNDYYEVKDAG